MSEENKQITDSEAIKEVLADVKGAETYAKVTDWAKDWRLSELTFPNPAAKQLEETGDAQLDEALNEMLTSPEVAAMLENVAADAADDELNASVKLPSNLFPTDLPSTSLDLQDLRKEFKAFEARVAAAFKHAGFKF